MRRSIRGWGGAGIAQWNSPTTKAPEDQRARPSAGLSGEGILLHLSRAHRPCEDWEGVEEVENLKETLLKTS